MATTIAELPAERRWRLYGTMVTTIGMLISLIAFIIFFIVKVFFS